MIETAFHGIFLCCYSYLVSQLTETVLHESFDYFNYSVNLIDRLGAFNNFYDMMIYVDNDLLTWKFLTRSVW